MENKVTFNRTANGIFDVLLNGQSTELEIINGDKGASGNSRNMYGILNTKTGLTQWLGSLAKCKKNAAFQVGGRA